MRHQYRKERTIQRKPEIPSGRVQDCCVFWRFRPRLSHRK